MAQGWAQYDGTPLQVHATPALKKRIEQIAIDEHVSKASVVRDILEAGIDDRERISRSRTTKEEATDG